ncbi:MBL fold metallo-hydrolase [Salsuginibacillus kocurii]|uniref:MBL fold metallo-hydrolase n=1 Tax=Salsuginibacillus kocurii TaxID=427078 RepID=UPI00035D7644|nr:MBL fold metallo-hydrolase [Salsuginibacillus kocurii]
MSGHKPICVAEDVYLIDGFDLNIPNRTGSYILIGDKVTIIETGPGLAVPQILAGLAELNIAKEQIAHIIVTHVHLDHAGGAGHLVNECPNATVFVHPRGLRHLADPKRLVAGTRAVYGEWFEELFDPVLPIPEHRLKEMSDSSRLNISSKRTLTFIDSPGHANHHFSIYDSQTHGVFTGDTAGIRYPDLEYYNAELYLPSTSPNQFNPEAMHHSLKRIFSLKPKTIFFGHFGPSDNTTQIYEEVSQRLEDFITIGTQVYQEHGNQTELAQQLFNYVEKDQALVKIPEEHPVRSMIQLDADISAMGLFDYFKRNSKD